MIARIKGVFQLFITADKNLRYQQNLEGRRVAILELPTNRLPKLLEIRDKVVQEIGGMEPGTYRRL